jgi:hypothetical protein
MVADLPRLWPPRVIGFDGDDTLWRSESLFSMTQGRFRMLLLDHVDLPSDLIDARLTETVQRNLALYGYGIKGFVLSMVETAIAVTDVDFPPRSGGFCKEPEHPRRAKWPTDAPGDGLRVSIRPKRFSA